MKRLEIKTGDRFQRLTILNEEKQIGKNRYFKCRCDCGNITIKRLSNIKNDGIKSCGCILKEINIKHKHSTNNKNTITYNSWRCMKQRCKNPNAIDYKDYGGRGITICERWLNSFQNFLEDMGERPEDKTLDRINNNGNYELSNCRWATHKQQRKNQRINVRN